VEAFARDGWKSARQRGSHVVLAKEGRMATLCVSDCREIAKGVLRRLIRASGLTVEEFVALGGQ